jgi:hypothetical protein
MTEATRIAALQISLAKLEEGKAAVEDAASKLEALLADLRVAPRAEKTNVSNAIETALERLRTARVKVAEAEKVIATEALVP